MANYQRSSVIDSSLWMVGVSLVLFFLPALNGLIGSGYKAGTVGRALSAAVLPAILVFFGVWGLMAMFDHAVLGFLSGIAVGLWALQHRTADRRRCSAYSMRLSDPQDGHQ